MQLRWKEPQRCDFGLTEEVLFVGFERRTRTTRAWRLETGLGLSFDPELSPRHQADPAAERPPVGSGSAYSSAWSAVCITLEVVYTFMNGFSLKFLALRQYPRY
jgi:hypothetical protein